MIVIIIRPNVKLVYITYMHYFLGLQSLFLFIISVISSRSSFLYLLILEVEKVHTDTVYNTESIPHFMSKTFLKATLTTL